MPRFVYVVLSQTEPSFLAVALSSQMHSYAAAEPKHWEPIHVDFPDHPAIGNSPFSKDANSEELFFNTYYTPGAL